MECNIDDRGARLRKWMGYCWLLIGVLLGAFAFWAAWWWLWIVAALAVAGGAFALFESRKKWCALRAMGIQTRI